MKVIAGCWLGGSLAFALAAHPALAQAAPPEVACPPDEWFCEAEPAPPPAEAPPDEAVGEAGEGESTEEPGTVTDEDDLAPAPYFSEPDITIPDRAASVPSPPPRRSDWSANLRVQGALLEKRRGSGSAGLAGVGASLRYRVNPWLTLDGGVDSLVGTDYNGYDRSELGLSFGTLLYLNPHQQVRTYALFGLHTSVAQVEVNRDDQSWSYFGGQAGLGCEIPFDWRIALNLELLGFIRGRTDSRAAREPEFSDDVSGRVTNMSGGGLFRAGITLRW